MAAPYFQNFPPMSYANTLCRDLTRRSVLNLTSKGIPLEYYPYEITTHLRTDHLAEYYYDDANYEWMAMLSNEIIDPYYGWYNTDETFEQLIIEKYGSIVNSQKYIKYYINNWASDTTILSPGNFNNVLEESLKKYWRPVFNRPTEIVGYERRPDNIVMNTNKILQYTISSNNDTIALQVGELVDIKTTGSEDVTANGQVETSNSTIVRVKNVTGNTFANTTIVKDLIGQTSNANVSVDEVVTLFENISNTEFAYYSPVTYWDWELEQREAAKNLNLVSDAAIDAVADEFERLMTFDVDPDTGLSTG